MLSTKDSLEIQRQNQVESEWMEKDIPCKHYPQKRARMAILISDKIDLKSKWLQETNIRDLKYY